MRLPLKVKGAFLQRLSTYDRTLRSEIPLLGTTYSGTLLYLDTGPTFVVQLMQGVTLAKRPKTVYISVLY